MKRNLRTILSGILLVSCLNGVAQVDPHFSQYFIQPMTLNPALTGAIEGDYRVSAVWRAQYENTFSTKGISGEAVTGKNLNIGANLLYQSSSDGSYNYSNASLIPASGLGIITW